MDIASISLTIYAAIIPSILLCIFVYRMDVVEKEPLKMLLIQFFLGILITIPAIFFEQTLMSIMKLDTLNYYDSFLLAFVVIALVEEGHKFLMLMLSSWNNKNFDYKYDAIVYSVFVSLGFASWENVLYLRKVGIDIAIWRGIISVPAHAFYAVACGFFLGIAKELSIKKQKKKSILFIILAFLIPVIIHGLFDFLLLTENDILLGVFFSFVAGLYIVSYFEIKKTYNLKEKLTKR